jgi:hypothetical protein
MAGGVQQELAAASVGVARRHPTPVSYPAGGVGKIPHCRSCDASHEEIGGETEAHQMQPGLRVRDCGRTCKRFSVHLLAFCLVHKKKPPRETHNCPLGGIHILLDLSALDCSADLHVEKRELEIDGLSTGSRHGMAA